MDIDQAQRMANLYDACWETVKEGTAGPNFSLSTQTRARFVACWGLASQDQTDETLIHWAKNFLRHNARPHV